MAYQNYGKGNQNGWNKSRNDGGRYQNSDRRPNDRPRQSNGQGQNLNRTPNTRVVAPYNFVPFPDQVLLRYQDVSELPRHDLQDPSLLSGEIEITVQADTPISVSDGNKQFYRSPSGQFAIPGSSVKGLVRESLQILGLGLVRPGEDLDDDTLLFRKFAAGKGANDIPLSEYYKGENGLRIKSDKAYSLIGNPPSRISVPQNIRAGYLTRENGKYYLMPAEGGKYYRLARNKETMDRLPLVGALRDASAKEISVFYRVDRGTVVALEEDDRNKAVPAGMKRGVVLVTGHSVGKMKNAVYLIPEAAGEKQAVSDADILVYAADLEARETVLKPKPFWALPRNGEKKAFFYYTNARSQTYFGRCLLIRIGYPHSIGKGLPARHRTLSAEKPVVLDYAHAMLGFAGKESSFRSRVSFEDLVVTDPNAKTTAVSAVLSSPKPSFVAGYLKGEKTTYLKDDFALRGYKQYWLQQNVSAAASEKANVNSSLSVLPKGSSFRGTIHFKNLHRDELGLLLWALRLDGKSFHQLGGGKPYGFGRVKLNIGKISRYNETLYQAEGLCAAPGDITAQASEYVEEYQNYAARILQKEYGLSRRPEDLPHVRDFLTMKGTITNAPEEFRYMQLPEYSNNSGILPTVNQYRVREFK